MVREENSRPRRPEWHWFKRRALCREDEADLAPSGAQGRSWRGTWVLVASLWTLGVGVGWASEGCKAPDLKAFEWQYITPGRIAHERGYEIVEELNPGTYERRDYIRKPGGKKELFYVHGRGIEAMPGHLGRFVLINDFLATKANRVMISDLRKRRWWQIDTQASRLYQREVEPDPQLIIVPVACGTSPDDQRVLISMDLIYASAATADAAGCLDSTFKHRWYVVDSRSGQVLWEYRSSPVPKAWWKRPLQRRSDFGRGPETNPECHLESAALSFVFPIAKKWASGQSEQA